MQPFAAALRAVKSLKEEGVVEEYAIGGAMAFAFWSEPTPTFDLDVFVLLPSTGVLVDLSTIYDWAKRHHYDAVAEHVVIAGVPVQVIPAHNELAAEAVRNAATLNYGDEDIRVITAEYLVALSLEPSARTAKRLVRVAAVLEDGRVDTRLLSDIVARYQLKLPDA